MFAVSQFSPSGGQTSTLDAQQALGFLEAHLTELGGTIDWRDRLFLESIEYSMLELWRTWLGALFRNRVSNRKFLRRVVDDVVFCARVRWFLDDKAFEVLFDDGQVFSTALRTWQPFVDELGARLQTALKEVDVYAASNPTRVGPSATDAMPPEEKDA